MLSLRGFKGRSLLQEAAIGGDQTTLGAVWDTLEKRLSAEQVWYMIFMVSLLVWNQLISGSSADQPIIYITIYTDLLSTITCLQLVLESASEWFREGICPHECIASSPKARKFRIRFLLHLYWETYKAATARTSLECERENVRGFSCSHVVAYYIVHWGLCFTCKGLK